MQNYSIKGAKEIMFYKITSLISWKLQHELCWEEMWRFMMMKRFKLYHLMSIIANMALGRSNVIESERFGRSEGQHFSTQLKRIINIFLFNGKLISFSGWHRKYISTYLICSRGKHMTEENWQNCNCKCWWMLVKWWSQRQGWLCWIMKWLQPGA